METPLNTDQIASDLYTRPSKRRKFYRKRGEEKLLINEDKAKAEADGPDNLHALTIDELISNHGSIQSPDAEQDQRLPLSAANLVCRRKAQRRRLGIEFNNSSGDRTSSAPLESNAVALQDDAPELKTLNDRFTAQTGQVADVDKHMYAGPPRLIIFNKRLDEMHILT